ncbi:MAG: SgcJ/EcaC family oxidoreductase [Pseudomonadota bacterium]
MSKFWPCLVAFALILAPPALAEETSSDEAAIAALWGSYEDALAAGDIDAWLSLWTQDGIQLPPGEPAVAGIEALRTRNGAALAAFNVTMEITLEETEILGDFAYSQGSYTAQFQPKGGGDALNVDGKFLSIMKRGEDGTWRIYRDMFNSNQ